MNLLTEDGEARIQVLFDGATAFTLRATANGFDWPVVERRSLGLAAALHSAAALYEFWGVVPAAKWMDYVTTPVTNAELVRHALRPVQPEQPVQPVQRQVRRGKVGPKRHRRR